MAIKITEATTPDAQDTIATRNTDRDADQIDMDKRVEAVKAEWEAAGKPDQKHSPFRRLTVPKDQRSELKKLIRRGATLAKVDPLYWQDTKPNDAGEITVKFTVGPQKVKVPATPAQVAEATETADQAAAAMGTGDQGGDQPQATPDQGRGRLLGSRR